MTTKRETTIRIPEPDAVQETLVRRLVSVKTTPTIVEEEYEHVPDESPIKRVYNSLNVLAIENGLKRALATGGIKHTNSNKDGVDQEQVIQRQVLKDPPFKRGITYWNPLNIPQYERGWKPPDDDDEKKDVDNDDEQDDGDDIRLPALTTESGAIQCER